MSDRGVFAVDRGVFDHPMFADEPFTEREAWMWLVGAAAWKQCRVRAGRRPMIVERGQAVFSERFLAERWRWSKSRVHRFLDRLKSDAMVTISADHETNRITICNYEKYAFDGTTRKLKNGPQTEPLADQPRTKEEEPKKDKNQELKKDTELSSDDDWPADFENRFWNAYPPGRKSGRQAVAKKLAAIRKSGKVTWARLFGGVQRYANSRPDPQFTKGPEVWLNKGCWDDETATPLPFNTGPPRARPMTAIELELMQSQNGNHHDATATEPASDGEFLDLTAEPAHSRA